MTKRIRPLPEDRVTARDPVRSTVSCQHERLVGRLIIEWSKIEGTMQEVLWTLMDIEWENGRIITQNMDATKKLQLIRTFSKRYLKPEEISTLTEVLDKIEELQEDRNVIAHGSWGTLIEDGQPIVMSLKRKSKPDQILTEGFPAWRMYKIIDDILLCRLALITWRREHEALPGRRTPPLYGDL